MIWYSVGDECEVSPFHFGGVVPAPPPSRRPSPPPIPLYDSVQFVTKWIPPAPPAILPYCSLCRHQGSDGKTSKAMPGREDNSSDVLVKGPKNKAYLVLTEGRRKLWTEAFLNRLKISVPEILGQVRVSEGTQDAFTTCARVEYLACVACTLFLRTLEHFERCFCLEWVLYLYFSALGSRCWRLASHYL